MSVVFKGRPERNFLKTVFGIQTGYIACDVHGNAKMYSLLMTVLHIKERKQLISEYKGTNAPLVDKYICYKIDKSWKTMQEHNAVSLSE